MKSFKEFIKEANPICNKTKAKIKCPVHGMNDCSGHSNNNENHVEENLKIKSHSTVKEIAKKHRLDVSFIKNQLEMGIKIEHEHTKDKDLAIDIALQHLNEIPDYYTRLKKMESSAKKDHNKFKDVKVQKNYSIATTHPGNFPEEKQYKNESVTIEDANGNTFLEIIDLIKPEKMKGVSEETKSGDSSLHDWFSKSKSSDGKPGWVQLGGRYAGKPCAKQPGQTTKPKCGSSKMAANMSDKEEEAAARRKRKEDPNPERSGKAKNVATEEFVNEDACKEKVKSRYKIWPSAYASGALVKCRKVGAANWGNKKEKSNVSENYLRIQTRGTTYSIILNWRGKYITTQMFFQQFTRPTKAEVTREVNKVYPNAIVLAFNPSLKDPTKPLLFTGQTNEPR
jgi:hypothetical protein